MVLSAGDGRFDALGRPSHSLIRLQCHLAGDERADDAMGIGAAQFDPRSREHGGRRFRRPVDPCRGQPRQLGHPAADVAALRVELLALADRVEDAEERRGVGPAAGSPLPAKSVAGQVGINQRLPEPPGALLSGEQEVLRQERRHHHPHTIVHPAGGPEFAHAGVHERIAGLAALPGAEPRGVLPPREPGEFGP